MDDNRSSNFRTGLVFDERMVEHHCLFDPEYPECPQRFSRSLQRCRDYGLVDRCVILNSRRASEEEVLTQHSQNLLSVVKSSDKCEDQDFLYKISSKYDAIYFHPSTYELALLSVGSTVDLVTEIVQGKLKNGMAIIRPPGHHAMNDKACGYCFFNNVGIAAKHALDNLGLQRILIVDWDVHHGQATQYAFYDDPRVLYFSIHRYEHGSFWPELRESNYDYIGEGKGKGFNINVPLNAIGMGNSEYLSIFHQILFPVAHEFSPELVIISAGYDAAVGCIEGQMEVTPVGYTHLTSLLMTLANGKVATILEGGYCLKSLSESVALTLRTLLGDPCPLLEPTSEPHESVVESILNVISVHRPYWNCFKNKSVDGETFAVNGLPDHTPIIKYLGHPPAEDFEFPVTGFYPTQTNEIKLNFDRRLDAMILETSLDFPPNRTAVVFDENMVLHRNHQDHGHPERPERYIAIISALKEKKILSSCQLLPSRMATEEELLLFHTDNFIKEMKKSESLKNKERYELADKYRSIYLCDDSYKSALMAAGCVLQVVDDVLSNKSVNGACIVRPPGHHAEKDECCGFCIFNNVAIAAKYALNNYKLDRILIVDWDVHHGNGIQNAFIDDPRVLYVSIHRYNNGSFFPGSSEGNFDLTGEGKGEGFNINIPWNSIGLGDGDYMSAFHSIILPVAYQFQPQLVFISAGFDAAKGDPLGQCKVTPEGYAHMTQMLMGLANGRTILALEGGYNLVSLSNSFAACVKVLLAHAPPSLKRAFVSPGAAKTINDVISVHKKYWSSLKYQVNFPPVESGEKLEGAVGGDNKVNFSISIQEQLASLQLEDSEIVPVVVIPKTDCPHIEKSVKTFKDDDLKLENLRCLSCKSSQENWFCLYCYKNFCGRYIEAHMLDHFLTEDDHCIAFSSCDFSFWCYKCESYIENSGLDAIKERAHFLKFGL